MGLKSLLRWMRHDGGFSQPPKATTLAHVKTSSSATVFTDKAEAWVKYLAQSREDRYDSTYALDIEIAEPRVRFHGHNQKSSVLADHLNGAFAELQQKLSRMDFVEDRFRASIFGNPGNQTGTLRLRVSSVLPAEASREVLLNQSMNDATANIVLRRSMVDTVVERIASAGTDITAAEHLGLIWPIVRRLFSQLSISNNPRDRFVEKIDVTVVSCLIAMNVLYVGKKQQRLVPNEVGSLYEEYIAERDKITRDNLFSRHPYFRLLNDLQFMFQESTFLAHLSYAQVMVREYLDGRYLRLSLAGVMPEVDETMARMPFHWEGNRVSTPYPRLRRFGILDEEDLNAWKKVEGHFRDMGFTLIRQLGIGQFGRVYEACNQFNPHIPRHVALKIDRIARGKKKEAIQSAEATMRIGEDLSTAPHVIRVFDAGKIKGKRYNYHVLQMVDGDTLDNLLGISGTEHSSMPRPRTGRRSEREVQQDYLKTIKASTREIWRRQRMTHPFTDPLDLAQTLDLITSILLWLEEIHDLGYAVNDLKNGNLMISRRGQLKGIDLDAYSVISEPTDKATDFFFLAVSLLLLLLNVKRPRDEPMTGCEGMMQSRDKILTGLQNSWELGNVARISKGRVETEQIIALLVDLIERSRYHAYAKTPDLFSADIDRLIALKRTIFSNEIVLD